MKPQHVSENSGADEHILLCSAEITPLGTIISRRKRGIRISTFQLWTDDDCMWERKLPVEGTTKLAEQQTLDRPHKEKNTQ